MQSHFWVCSRAQLGEASRSYSSPSIPRCAQSARELFWPLGSDCQPLRGLRGAGSRLTWPWNAGCRLLRHLDCRLPRQTVHGPGGLSDIALERSKASVNSSAICRPFWPVPDDFSALGCQLPVASQLLVADCRPLRGLCVADCLALS